MFTNAQHLKTDAVLTPAETRVAVGYCYRYGFIGKEIADRLNIS